MEQRPRILAQGERKNWKKEAESHSFASSRQTERFWPKLPDDSKAIPHFGTTSMSISNGDSSIRINQSSMACLGLYLILIVALQLLLLPGASICEEDTQIYLPILLKAQDASLLKNDLITQHPHTAFTLFDELVLFVSRFFGLKSAFGLDSPTTHLKGSVVYRLLSPSSGSWDVPKKLLWRLLAS